ncbi:hypothetical protein [Rurimicrobium arvi]|uniref:Lipocalin-like domain-containing protein n=1 Tax=Rurimicrobium arvi TaxID=2049916 RepID=A0ABP8MTI6_9BACT
MMKPKFALVALLMLFIAACGEPYERKEGSASKGGLPYRKLIGRWRCFYRKTEESSDKPASYRMHEQFYPDTNGGMLNLYPDRTFLHNIGLPENQYAKGSISLYDSVDQEMVWYSVHSYADSTDSVNRFINNYDVRFDKDTLILISESDMGGKQEKIIYRFVAY